MHKLEYHNTGCTWDEALFLGNGFFGGMLYNQQTQLTCVMNHFDIFYSKQYMYEKISKNRDRAGVKDRYREITNRAFFEHNKSGSKDHRAYPYTLFPEYKENYGWDRTGCSYPVTCELTYDFDEAIVPFGNTKASMDLAKGAYTFTANKGSRNIQIKKTIIRDLAVMVVEIESSHKDSISELELNVPYCSGIDRTVRSVKDPNSRMIARCTQHITGKPEDKGSSFSFSISLELKGIGYDDVITHEKGFKIKNPVTASKAWLIISVSTVLEAEDALKKSDMVSADPGSYVSSTENYWNEFFKKSWIDIPDKFLEKLWYINLYSLDCSSGNGAVIKKNACGLSGLWSIKQPSQWGSLWYWDVNIEQAYWPVYTSNHLYIAQAFIDGLLCYVDEAKQRAARVFGMNGIAADYPFEFFMSLWPWCAQFFWWNYKYSMDEIFLKEKAYPLFKEIVLFFTSYLKYDKEKDEYYIFPDISPEQGPVTRNSTITLSCLKFLLEFTIEASLILDCDIQNREKWQDLLDKLPEYPIADTKEFGRIIKDSEWADDDLYLAHSSLIMPIYPVGHISKRSTGQFLDIALNTMEYVDKRINIVTHAFGWEACALTRLGFASDALRTLYEKGIAHSLRTNGLYAEETNRWIQNCLTACAPVYNPPLLEAGSSTAAAVNEMLLASFDDIIEVFPSIPDGNYKLKKKTDRRFEEIERKDPGYVDDWRDISFNGLLAQGGFVVSAIRENRKTRVVKIRSLKGGQVKIIDPFEQDERYGIYSGGNEVKYTKKHNMIYFDTVKGSEYILRSTTENEIAYKKAPCDEPLKHTSFSNRRIFIGKDEHTDFLMELDNATFDYYQGDIRTSRVAVYRFDFGHAKDELIKNYETILPKQYHACGKLGLDFKRISVDTGYNDDRGYGWIDTADLMSVDRKNPDELRRDFIQGRAAGEFRISLAKGSYKIYFGTGDIEENCSLKVDINGSIQSGLVYLIKGRYKMINLLYDHIKDGPALIRFSSDKVSMWKINLMIVNRLL